MVDGILIAVGLIAVLWWVTGVILFSFFCEILVMPGTPWWPRFMTVLISGFTLPALVLMMGRLPTGVVISNTAQSPEQEKQIEQWLQSRCQCPKCRRRRGEIE